MDGGTFGNKDAYGMTVEQNYGKLFLFTTLKDVVNNFIVGL